MAAAAAVAAVAALVITGSDRTEVTTTEVPAAQPDAEAQDGASEPETPATEVGDPETPSDRIDVPNGEPETPADQTQAPNGQPQFRNEPRDGEEEAPTEPPAGQATTEDVVAGDRSPQRTYQAISAGGVHNCALAADGTLSCWGDKGFGQLDAPEGTYQADPECIRGACRLRGVSDAVAQRQQPVRCRAIRGTNSPGSVTKDGYELRINKPDPGITLWDLNENRQILEGAPDSLRESGVGEAFAVTFEDPVTGSDLVTFTWDDLSEVLGPAHYPRGDAWVGWSADGIDWEWQDAAGLLGASRFIGFPHLDLAVGSGFLLAQKRGSGQEPSRSFMAKVPSG